MSNAEQLLYQTEKSNHRSFSTKTLFLKFLLYSWENTCVKFLKTPILKNICVVILQKYQSLSNQNFKQNLAHLTSMHLIPTLSCEPRFRVFTVNDYKIKIKCLQSLESLLKDVVIYYVFFDQTGNTVGGTVQHQHWNQYLKFIYIEMSSDQFYSLFSCDHRNLI